MPLCFCDCKKKAHVRRPIALLKALKLWWKFYLVIFQNKCMQQMEICRIVVGEDLGHLWKSAKIYFFYQWGNLLDLFEMECLCSISKHGPALRINKTLWPIHLKRLYKKWPPTLGTTVSHFCPFNYYTTCRKTKKSCSVCAPPKTTDKQLKSHCKHFLDAWVSVLNLIQSIVCTAVEISEGR